MPLDLPDGSTLQWGTGRGLLSLAPLVDIYLFITLRTTVRRQET